MLKSIVSWLIARKVKNAAGEMEAKGVSVTKICAVILGLIQAVEFALPFFGISFTVPAEVKAFILSIGGIAVKEALDRSAPPKPKEEVPA